MKIDFTKGDGLIAAVIQDNATMHVLMVGYMNEEAYLKTVTEKRVTFYSRSRGKLWTKDTLLVKVDPAGPVCHLGTYSCFGEEEPKGFLYKLENIISSRIEEDASGSYTNKLYKKGINKIAQKVGEEAVELIIEAKDNDIDLFINEAADLLYHLLILLRAKSLQISDIEAVLSERHKAKI
jgi:phosphoribosyl-ATP pyrophosphohydrolase/phosphoribosyl-AMP cyclohydrolase